ncbi:MAG: class I SAM-dependent methyltransferase [bacterium]
MRSVIAAFLDACNGRGQPCQILSLGAGFDTAYWVMKRLQKLDTCTWVEVDFPETVCPGQICLGAVGAVFRLRVMHTLPR